MGDCDCLYAFLRISTELIVATPKSPVHASRFLCPSRMHHSVGKLKTSETLTPLLTDSHSGLER
jgi:hypothetical protein